MNGTDGLRDNENSQAKNKQVYQVQKPYIIHRSANAIITAGQNQMFKTERVSYKIEFNRFMILAWR